MKQIAKKKEKTFKRSQVLKLIKQFDREMGTPFSFLDCYGTTEWIKKNVK